MAIIRDWPLFIEIEQVPEAIELSEIVDPDAKRLFGGSYLYGNSLGGKITVYPFDIAKMGKGFLDPTRKKMLYNILKWLSGDTIPLFMEGEREVLPLRCDFPEYSVVSLFNLSHDDLLNISAEMNIGNKEIENAQYLALNGEWQTFNNLECDGSKLKLKIDKLTFDKPLFVTINFKG